MPKAPPAPEVPLQPRAEQPSSPVLRVLSSHTADGGTVFEALVPTSSTKPVDTLRDRASEVSGLPRRAGLSSRAADVFGRAAQSGVCRSSLIEAPAIIK
jgi:hypothetical protein